MSRIFMISMTAATALTACTSGQMGGSGQMVQRVNAASSSTLGNTLVQSDQGTSGGVLAIDGQPPVAGVEATMSYNSAGASSGARVDFHNGPMTGVGVRCARAGGGASVPECTAVNAESAFLVNELHGRYAYAGAFAVNGYGADKDQNGFVAIHSGTEGDRTLNFPGSSVNYNGRFQSGGSITSGGRTFSGRGSGTAALTADFAAGSINGTFTGQLRDDTSGLSTDLNAGFTGATIDQNGRFFNTSDTTFSYGNAQAWGELDGAFYGPSAEEAAGTFGFGNSKGGMTGIMVGCSEYLPSNCVAPSPRF